VARFDANLRQQRALGLTQFGLSRAAIGGGFTDARMRADGLQNGVVDGKNLCMARGCREQQKNRWQQKFAH
jgi:hypothetical protein